MKSIKKAIKENEKRIFTNTMFPGSKASDILVNELNYSYKNSRKKFAEYCRDNGLIFNYENF